MKFLIWGLFCGFLGMALGMVGVFFFVEPVKFFFLFFLIAIPVYLIFFQEKENKIVSIIKDTKDI